MNLSKDFWEKAYIENAPKMKGVCRRYVSDIKVAEDLMHDAFIVAINKQNTFKGKGSFEGWLRKITVNTALMYLRKKDSVIEIENWVLYEDSSQIMEEINTKNIKGVIEHADFSDMELLEVIDELPEHHKRVFNLYVIDKYTHAQIGKELNISSGTSKSHLARARKKIQKLLYQKAIDHKYDQNKKKRASIFLLIIPWKSNYIDVIFKNKLMDFSLVTSVNSSVIFNSINWNLVSTPAFKLTLWGIGVKNLLLATSGGIIMTSIVVTTIDKKPQIPVETAIDSVIIDDQIESVEIKDSSYLMQEIDTVISTANFENKEKKKQPVVIKKKIVQRKTVIIRDTIKITDKSDVQ